MDNTKIGSLQVNGKDMLGNTVLEIYGMVSEVYAVYQTNKRVAVYFSDDPTLGSEQRQLFRTLNPIRGEINGLLDGWRSDGTSRGRASGFERRVGDALIVGFQGDVDGALATLTRIKEDIEDERKSFGRINYLVLASSVAVLAMVIWIIYLRHYDSHVGGDAADPAFILAETLLWSVPYGILGALFSICISIRGRTLLTDLRNRDNVLDAALRMAIGAIAAFILVALLKSQLVTFTGVAPERLIVGEPFLFIVVAFLAGFSERLVGDLLGETKLAAGVTLASGAKTSAAPRLNGAANERNPMGAAPARTAGGPAGPESPRANGQNRSGDPADRESDAKSG